MPRSVLDASALIALMNLQPGADRVSRVIQDGAIVSTVTVSEVVAYLNERNLSEAGLQHMLQENAIEVIPFDSDAAFETSRLGRRTRAEGLSLGDRACLALAARLGLTAITADRAWSRVRTGAKVFVFR